MPWRTPGKRWPPSPRTGSPARSACATSPRTWCSAAKGCRHVDAVQNHFSLLHRDEHAALSAHCARSGTTFIAYGPLALGLLTGTTGFAGTSWGRGKTVDQLSPYQRSLFGPNVLERHLAYVERLQTVADDAGLPLAQVALAWETLRDEFTVAIAGSTSAANTRAHAAAGNLQLQPSVMAELERCASTVKDPRTPPVSEGGPGKPWRLNA